jgi:hypothetical protein
MKDGLKEKPDGIIALARETADALGRLTVQHLRLARLEMRADMRAMGLQAGLIAVLAALAVVGYALAMAGLALVITSGWRSGLAFLVIGGGHVLAAGIGILIAVERLRRMRPMNATADEVNRSLAPLGLSSGAETGPTPPSPGSGKEERQ